MRHLTARGRCKGTEPAAIFGPRCLAAALLRLWPGNTVVGAKGTIVYAGRLRPRNAAVAAGSPVVRVGRIKRPVTAATDRWAALIRHAAVPEAASLSIRNSRTRTLHGPSRGGAASGEGSVRASAGRDRAHMALLHGLPQACRLLLERGWAREIIVGSEEALRSAVTDCGWRRRTPAG